MPAIASVAVRCGLFATHIATQTGMVGRVMAELLGFCGLDQLIDSQLTVLGEGWGGLTAPPLPPRPRARSQSHMSLIPSSEILQNLGKINAAFSTP